MSNLKKLSEQEIFEKVVQVIFNNEKRFDPNYNKSIEMYSTFESIDYDELDVVELLLSVESEFEEYGISFSTDPGQYKRIIDIVSDIHRQLPNENQSFLFPFPSWLFHN